jgi:L-tartrate/succinate antiporter
VRSRLWRALAPPLLTLALALLSAPAGLALHAWRYFAIFMGVVLALVLEPVPAAVGGLAGVSLIAVLAPYALFGPAELAQPGFGAPAQAIRWALGGFSNPTVWLIFAAFMFALGYEKTGLGRRLALHLVRRMGRSTLMLGYAVVLADLVLAPFTPSNTARSGGIVFPIIRNLPPLYGSHPNQPSARRIGGYLMWTALASTCVTASMFLTGLAPNLLALEIARKTVGLDVTWLQWLVAFLPAGLVLLVAVPWLGYVLYAPEVKAGEEATRWADSELAALGPLTPGERTLAGLVGAALLLWILGGAIVDPTSVALSAVVLMVLTGVVSWEDVLSNRPAWNTLVWFATLVALAGGLIQVGLVPWFAKRVAGALEGAAPVAALVLLVALFFLLHYLFASVTAHTTALLPVFLAAGSAIPGMPMRPFGLALLVSLGIMGIVSPYGTGPSPVYYGSGYIPSRDFWRLGAVFGAIYLAVLVLVGIPWLLALG